jgi:hypothetical protein
VEHGWWQRTPTDFGNQLELCNYCGLAQPGPSQIDTLERDIISGEHRARLEGIGSPAIRKGRYELFDRAFHTEQRKIETRDNYMGDGRRVGIGHNSTKPKKLSGVLVSVGYGRALAETLPENARLFDEMVVVTTPEDTLTQGVAAECGAKVVLSRRCYDDDHSFNKGRMLNDGLAALKDPDWIVSTDADIFLNPATRAVVLSHSFNPGCIYYTARRDRTAVPGQPDHVNMEPNGYFQLFHPRAMAIRDRWPAPVSEEFCSAGGVDSYFSQQWAPEKRIAIPELSVEHLSSRWLGENWNGTEPRAGSWPQLCVLTPNGFATFLQMSKLPDVIKLTDTRYGQSVVIETKDFDAYVKRIPSGLAFLGKDIGWCHVHVAYKD